MDGHHESAEVARVRRLLATMTASPREDAPEEEGSVPSIPRPPAAVPPTSCGSAFEACCQPDDAGGRTGSFSTSARCVSLAWHRTDDPTHRGTIDVPRCVGKRFGVAVRSFPSLGALRSTVDMLTDQVAFERIESSVRARERSSSEIQRRLIREGFTAEQARRALDRATRCGLVDDARFAEAFIAAKRRAGWGQGRIERELAANGIEVAALADCSVPAANREDERARAHSVLKKKGIPAKNPVEKLARHLVTKGYEPALALSVARAYVAEAAEQGGREINLQEPAYSLGG